MTNPTGYTELDLVGFTDKGEYSPSANYVQNDIVQYNYVAWRCKVDDTTGITPTEGTNWTVFVGNPPSTSVTGVKGNAETDYRTGDVNLTPANIGAYSKSEVDTALNGKLGTSGASTNTTVAFTSNDLAANTTEKTRNTTNQPSTVAKLSSGETLASMFGKISSMFASIRKLWNTVGTTALNTDLGQTVTAQLNAVNNRYNYSATEQLVGKWFGNDLYRKCLRGTVNVTGSVVWHDLFTDNNNTYNWISLSGMLMLPSGQGIAFDLWNDFATNGREYRLRGDIHVIKMLVGDSLSVNQGNSTYNIIGFYTKS